MSASFFTRNKGGEYFLSVREPFHTISKPQVRTWFKVFEMKELRLYFCLRVPAVSLDFISQENKDFDCVYLHQKKRKNNNLNDIDMRFIAIDTSAWEELKKSIEDLTLCMKEYFGMKPELPDLLHNGDACRILNISKRTLQHYRDTSVLPFIQIGHKCYYKREDVEVLLAKSNRK